jgi:hypothetical protein
MVKLTTDSKFNVSWPKFGVSWFDSESLEFINLRKIHFFGFVDEDYEFSGFGDEADEYSNIED